MGTSNFWSMREFDIYCQIEEYDEEFYRQEYPEEDEESRFRIHCDSSNFRYNETWKSLEKEIEKTDWMFHKAELRNGYYEGIQIYIREPDGKWFDLDLEGSYEDMTGRRCKHNKRELRHRYWKEVNLIREWLEEMRGKYGLTVLRTYARFSNGETWYKYVDENGEVVS